MTLYVNKYPQKWPSLLACDLETTGLDPHKHKILSAAFSDGVDTWIFLHFHPTFAKLAAVFSDPDLEFIFFNAKFDFQFIWKRWQTDIVRFFDCLLAEQVINAGIVQPNSLDQVLARQLGIFLEKQVVKEFADHPGFIAKPVTDAQLTYMMEDVNHLPALREKQLKQISDARLGRAMRIELDTIPATAALEYDGICFDVDLWFAQLAYFEEQKTTCVDLMRRLLGSSYSVTVDAREKKQDIKRTIPVEKINFASPTQLLAVLRSLGANIESTGDAVLQELLITEQPGEWKLRELVKTVLDFRKWNKRIGFNYPKYVNIETGRVHPEYHQLGARTGRFSCSNPNLQQVPRPAPDEPNMRLVWTADNEDFVLLRADYSQQEPRIMAELSGDEQMIAACNKDDVYLEFAAQMYGHKITKESEERQIMKSFVLAVGYGAGVDRLHAASGLPKKDCERIRDQIKATFPVMAAYGSVMERQLQTYGFVTTASGRRRNFPEYHTRTYAAAVNTPIQGTAADMFKLALARIYKYLTEEKKCGTIHPSTRIALLIHDEVVIHCHKEDVEKIRPVVCSLMEEAGHELCPRVKHFAEANYGYRWDK